MPRVGAGIATSVMAIAIVSACGGSKPEPVSLAVVEANAANQARATLSLFLEHLKAHPSDPAGWLTIRMPPEGADRPQAELSVKDIVQTGETSFSGVIWRQDKNWPEFPAGATMSFPASIVTDWVYFADNNMVGGYQLRATLCLASQSGQDIPPSQARELRAEAEQAASFMLDKKGACEPYDPEKTLKVKAK